MLKRLWLIVGVAVVLACTGSASAATIPGQYIVVLKGGVSEQSAVADAKKAGADVFMRYRYAFNGYAARMSDAQLGKARADPRVAFISKDEEMHTAEIPTGINRIDGDLSSTVSGDDQGRVNINVAVLDTGIGLDREDLNVAGGVDCMGKKGDGTYDDHNGHGTEVGGVIAAKDDGRDTVADPNDPSEIVGVVPGASLWAVKVLSDKGSGSSATIACGVDFITATRTDANPANDIAVANASIGGHGKDDHNCGRSTKDVLHLAICNSVARGVTYAVAAGNEKDDLQAHSPANYNEVLAVTAMSDLDGRPGGLGTVSCAVPKEGFLDDIPAPFSNFATLPEDKAHTIAAPGVCIKMTAIAPLSWRISAGTSFASPHAAGTAALCIAAGPCAGLTPAQVISKLIADAASYNQANPSYGFTGDPLHSSDPNKYYGYLIRAGLY